jgi:hypothetical protein
MLHAEGGLTERIGFVTSLAQIDSCVAGDRRATRKQRAKHLVQDQVVGFEGVGCDVSD